MGATGRRILIGGVVLVVLGLIGAGGAVAAGLLGAPAPEYRTAEVTRGDLSETVALTGSVTRVNQASETFPTSGTVTWVGVQIGEKVTKGQPMARIEKLPLQVELVTAEADLIQARAAYQRDLKAADDAAEQQQEEEEEKEGEGLHSADAGAFGRQRSHRRPSRNRNLPSPAARPATGRVQRRRRGRPAAADDPAGRGDGSRSADLRTGLRAEPEQHALGRRPDATPPTATPTPSASLADRRPCPPPRRRPRPSRLAHPDRVPQPDADPHSDRVLDRVHQPHRRPRLVPHAQR